MTYLRIQGAEQLGELSKRLKAQGAEGKGLRREMLKTLRAAAQPAADAARNNIKALPAKPPVDRGLRAQIARAVKVRIRTTGPRVGVRISVGRLDGTNLPRRMNKGQWRHPVFGGDKWVTQTVRPGWFDDAMRSESAVVRHRMLTVLRTVAGRIAK